MAEDLKTQIVIEAQDRASAIINNVAGQLGGLGEVMQTLASKGGLIGIGIATAFAATAGATLMGVKLAEEVEQLDRLSTRTGVSVENLQVLRQVVKEMGGDVGTLTTALTYLNRSIAQQDPILKQLGITSKDAFTVFMQLSDAFSHSDDSAKKAEISFQLMGRGAADLLGIMPGLAGAFDKTRDSMDAAGGILKGSVLEGARNLHEESEKLGRSWTSLMTNIKAATLPTATSVVNAMNDMWDAMSGHRKTPAEETQRQVESITAQIHANEKELHRILSEGPGNFMGRNAEEQEQAKQRWVKNLQDLIDGLKNKLQDLNSVTKGIEDDAGLYEKAMLEASKADVVGKAKVAKEEKSDREKGIERIIELTGKGRAEAEYYYDALNRLEGSNMLDRLRQGPAVPASLEKFNADVVSIGKSFDVAADEVGAFFEKLRWDEALKNTEAFDTDLAAMAARFHMAVPAAQELWEAVKAGNADAAAKAIDKLNDSLGRVGAVFGASGDEMRAFFAQARDASTLNDAIDGFSARFGFSTEAATIFFDTVRTGGAEGLGQLMSDILDLGTLFTLDGVAAANMYARIKALDDEQKRRSIRAKLGETTVPDVLDETQKAMDAITSLAGIVNDSLQTAFTALDGGFRNAMTDIVAGTATAGSIVKTIWASVVDAIIAELARIAAAQVIAGIVNFLTGGLGGFLSGEGMPGATAPETMAQAPPQPVEAVWAPLPPLPAATLDATVNVPDLAATVTPAWGPLPPVPGVALTAAWAPLPPLPEATLDARLGPLPTPDVIVTPLWGRLPRLPSVTLDSEVALPKLPTAEVEAAWAPLPELPSATLDANVALPEMPTVPVAAEWQPLPELPTAALDATVNLPALPDATIAPTWGPIPKLPDATVDASVRLPKLPGVAVAAKWEDLPALPDVTLKTRMDPLALPDVSVGVRLDPMPKLPDAALRVRMQPLPRVPDVLLNARVRPFVLPDAMVRARVQPLPVAPTLAMLRAQAPPVAASVLRQQPKPVQTATTVIEKKPHDEPLPQNIQNIMVVGYDNHTILQDMTSPTGKLRAANGRITFMGAY